MVRSTLTGLAILIASLAVSVADAYSADLLPLAPGNGWTYRNAATGESFSVRVGSPVYLNERVYHSLRGYAAEPLLVRVNEYGNIVYWDEEAGQDVLLISFEAVPRAWWEAPKRGECTDQGQTTGERVAHDGPAGRWNALLIHYRTFRCADAGSQSEQFAENIGMVRRVTNTFAGPRVYDLVYARIGNTVITAGDTGAFTVSAAPSPRDGYWTLTMRLSLPAGTSLKLRFPSSQQYDARLRDTEGNILWTWSADKLFLQMLRDVTLQGGYTASIEVPYPPATPEDAHFYTIEAWLTTAQDEPQFAAVTGVVRR